jgi:hypothetical protein
MTWTWTAKVDLGLVDLTAHLCATEGIGLAALTLRLYSSSIGLQLPALETASGADCDQARHHQRSRD